MFGHKQRGLLADLLRRVRTAGGCKALRIFLCQFEHGVQLEVRISGALVADVMLQQDVDLAIRQSIRIRKRCKSNGKLQVSLGSNRRLSVRHKELSVANCIGMTATAWAKSSQ